VRSPPGLLNSSWYFATSSCLNSRVKSTESGPIRPPKQAVNPTNNPTEMADTRIILRLDGGRRRVRCCDWLSQAQSRGWITQLPHPFPCHEDRRDGDFTLRTAPKVPRNKAQGSNPGNRIRREKVHPTEGRPQNSLAHSGPVRRLVCTIAELDSLPRRSPGRRLYYAGTRRIRPSEQPMDNSVPAGW
jgi:hypothetical protein